MSKLPLSIRKEVRDGEARKTEILSKISKTTGVPVTFNYPIEEVYEKISSNSSKDEIVNRSFEYLENLGNNFEKTFKDDHVKQTFLAAWKTKNISLVALSDDDYKKARKEKNMEGSCDSYNGVRFNANGDLEIVINPENFSSNTRNTGEHNLLAAVPSDAGGLPLEHQKKYNDNKPRIDEQLALIKKLKGLGDVTFEWDPMPVFEALKHNFETDAVVDYVKGTRELLEKLWKDDMIQEAILDEWKAPHKLTLLGEQDMKALKNENKCVKDSYNGFRLAEGKLDILAGKTNWGSNSYKIADHDISKIL